MFKLFRVVILLLILASVASTVLIQRNVSSDWSGTLDIRIIPIVADSAPETKQYVARLEQKDFQDIERYLIREAANYKINLTHGFDIRLDSPVNDIPPVVPAPNSGALKVALWSLSLRWWAWRNQTNDYHNSQIRLYVLYQNPDSKVALAHSTGLRNGLIGLINARIKGRTAGFHNLVITHELLHIFGATDKYDLSNGVPVFPAGYAEPSRSPIHPQKKAEIMGRAIPISPNRFKVARRLHETIIGKQTAREIAWTN